MTELVSVIIPNRNGSATIGKCLEAALASRHENFEVIVVDDASQDESVSIVARYPCTLVRLPHHVGAGMARNVGAQHSRGRIFFFTDADCLLQRDTLFLAVDTLSTAGPKMVTGGTYTLVPYDRRFFSRFQSVLINHAETRRAPMVDYITTHALAISAEAFRTHQGFAASPLPILEDVEFSHRLRRAGFRLVMNPAIQVQHMFDYSLSRSLRNAFVKSKYWICYAIGNRDLLADSGSASRALKVNVCSFVVLCLLLMVTCLSGPAALLTLAPLVLAVNVFVNRGLLHAFYRAEGAGFAAVATLYYMFPYAAAVVAGAISGLVWYLRRLRQARAIP